MNPTPFILKTALISSTLVPHARSADTQPTFSAPVSPAAVVPVCNWPERQDRHELPHLPPEERVTVDLGASGSFTNTSARTVSGSYTLTPWLRNELSDKLIMALAENVLSEQGCLATVPNQQVQARPDTKKHLSTASNRREERARVSRPRFNGRCG